MDQRNPDRRSASGRPPARPRYRHCPLAATDGPQLRLDGGREDRDTEREAAKQTKAEKFHDASGSFREVAIAILILVVLAILVIVFVL